MNDVYQFDESIYFVDMFLSNIMSQWLVDVKYFLDQNLISLILLVIAFITVLIIAYIIQYKLMFGLLEKKYTYYKYIYSFHMPSYLVANERVIKAKLVINNILRK